MCKCHTDVQNIDISSLIVGCCCRTETYVLLRENPTALSLTWRKTRQEQIDVMNSVWMELPELHGVSLPSQSVRLVDVSSPEGRRGSELRVRLTRKLHRRSSALWNYRQNKQFVNLGEFILWYLMWGFVCADSVWSAAHTQSSALQYPFLVQPEPGGTPQPCSASEPRPPLPGKAHTVFSCCLSCIIWFFIQFVSSWLTCASARTLNYIRTSD